LPKVVITKGPEAGKEYSLEQAVILGRLESNDIPIHDKKASREHAKIYRQGTQYAIVDLNSSNGTFVNGEQVTKRVLKIGDEISIGMVSLRFEDPEAELAAVAAPAAGRKGLDEAFEAARKERAAGGGAPAASGTGGVKIEMSGWQPLQFSKVKRGNPLLNLDFDQMSSVGRAIAWIILLLLFCGLMYVGYLVIG
jgi:predicted component of type VI protein secretion system